MIKTSKYIIQNCAYKSKMAEYGCNVMFVTQTCKIFKLSDYQNYCIDSNNILHNDNLKCSSYIVENCAVKIQDNRQPPFNMETCHII